MEAAAQQVATAGRGAVALAQALPILAHVKSSNLGYALRFVNHDRRHTPGVKRLILLAFGAAFLVLFAVVAIGEGIGDPAVPAGAIAIVEGTPSGTVKLTEADLERGLEQEVAPTTTSTRPEKPRDPGYNKLRDETLNSLLDRIWIQAEAEDRGFTATDKEVIAEVEKSKKSFSTEAEYEKFLRESNLTPADVRARMKLTMLSGELEKAVTGSAPRPSKDEVTAYYDEVRSTQFTTKASRDVRLMVNKEKRKVEEAKRLLEKDDSATSWRRVAKAYASVPAARKNGGLQEGLTEGAVGEPLNAEIFETPEEQLKGPIEAGSNFYVFEVENITPENVRSLADVESTIESQLSQRATQEAIERFLVSFAGRWTARTYCATGFTTEHCANSEGIGHPGNAPSACYDASPKKGMPDACPAPVALRSTVLPGSVSVLEPRGKALPQRPRPAGHKAGAEE